MARDMEMGEETMRQVGADLNDLKNFRSLLFIVVIHQVLIALIIFYHSRFVRYHWTPVSSPLWVACSEIREKAASPSPPAEFRPS